MTKNKLHEVMVNKIESSRKFYSEKEPYYEFVHCLSLSSIENLAATLDTLLDSENEKLLAHEYGISEEELHLLEKDLLEALLLRAGDTQDEDNNEDIGAPIETPKAQRMCSYLLGCAMARWDIRYSIGETDIPKNQDLFSPLPTCPYGMLKNKIGLPAEEKDLPANYPLSISWDGILVDDAGHPKDLVAKVRRVIEVIWQEKAADNEQELCSLLNLSSLRDYFSKPGRFFADHLKCYSKGRRQAPIYWPLSSPSGSYTLWLYYPRLTDQTLYTCINDYIEPKLKLVSEAAGKLRTKSKRSRQDETDLEKLADLEKDISSFRDDIQLIARFWKPDLNDGVLITAAPLWGLFKFKPWQRALKETWDKLERGELDWAHMALSIWPDRVVKACAKDHSYAIAHDLEEELWEESRAGRGNAERTAWSPKTLREKQLKEIVQKTMAR